MVEGWKVEDGKLVREYKFPTFADAIAFINKVADIAEQLDHHPEITSNYTTVTLRLFTHDAGSITDKDKALAEEINKI
jgi:4a-hydroxytetrahydrobiopterin dehydratase